MKKAAAKTFAAEEAKIAKTVDFDVDFAEMCLPGEDKAYEDVLDFRLSSADHRLAEERVRKAARPLTIPLRNDTTSVNSHGSTRSRLASADDGS